MTRLRFSPSVSAPRSLGGSRVPASGWHRGCGGRRKLEYTPHLARPERIQVQTAHRDTILVSFITQRCQPPCLRLALNLTMKSGARPARSTLSQRRAPWSRPMIARMFAAERRVRATNRSGSPAQCLAHNGTSAPSSTTPMRSIGCCFRLSRRDSAAAKRLSTS